MTDTQILCEIVGPEKMKEIMERLGGRRICVPQFRIWLTDANRSNLVTIFSESQRQGSTVMNSYQIAADEAGVSVRQAQRVVAAS
jgi:hypothetical protein